MIELHHITGGYRDAITQLKQELKHVKDSKELQTIRSTYLGKDGKFKTAIRQLQDVAKAQRPVVAAEINHARKLAEDLITVVKKELSHGSKADT